MRYVLAFLGTLAVFAFIGSIELAIFKDPPQLGARYISNADADYSKGQERLPKGNPE